MGNGMEPRGLERAATLLRNIMFYQQQSTPGKRVSARPNNKESGRGDQGPDGSEDISGEGVCARSVRV